MKSILIAAVCFGGSAVMLGAFGAHALKGVLIERALETFDVGVKYQMWHSTVLLFVALVTLFSPHPLFKWSAIFFIVGVLLFSGSLYLLAFGAPRWIGPITPLGGLCFIAGWVTLLVAVLRSSYEN